MKWWRRWLRNFAYDVDYYWTTFVLGKGEQGRWCAITDCKMVRRDPPVEMFGAGHTYRFRRTCARCGAPDSGSALTGKIEPEG